MLRKDFSRKAPGQFVPTLQGTVAFVPQRLPPALTPTWQLTERLVSAERRLSEFAGLVRGLPNPRLVWGSLSRREAVLSSRIEGTVSDATDLALFEASELASTPAEDAREVLNHVVALNYAVDRLTELPITLRLLRDIHGHLMRGVRGERDRPGEFRAAQNWIGPPGSQIETATFVPPPPPEMLKALCELERFINDDRGLPLLIRVALAHYQFEAIHPFRDGNGRMGRVLIALMLIAEGALPGPILYLSDFLESNRREYYHHLLAVSQRAEWTEWIQFFLRGIEATAEDAVLRTRSLRDYWESCRDRVSSAKSAGQLLRLVEQLFVTPAVTVQGAATHLGLTYRAAQRNIDRLVAEGILSEATGRRRHRVYLATKIIRIAQSNDVGE